MFAKFILVLSLFTGLNAAADSGDNECAEALGINPGLIQIAKKAAVSQFNSSPVLVMRYVDSQVLNKVNKDPDGTLTFDIDVIYGYQPDAKDQKSNYIVKLDKDGNSLDETSFFGATVPPFIRATKKPKVVDLATEEANVREAVRDFIENNQSPYRTIASISLDLTENKTTGEHNYFASVKVNIHVPPLGARLQFYNVVVSRDGKIIVTASGGQG